MKVRPIVFTALFACGSAFSGFAMENDRLNGDERARVGHLYAKVIRDKEVQEAREAHEMAAKHYHDVLRQAMIKQDPKVESALKKIRRNPSLLAEAIWEKRNNDVLNNLHLPVSRLDKEERDIWNRAMGNLRKKEMTKAFGKRLTDNYNQQAKLRKKQIEIMSNFKEEAKRALGKIDGRVKPLLEKLSGPAPKLVEPKDGGGEPQTTEVEEVEELPMPMPMPPVDDEC